MSTSTFFLDGKNLSLDIFEKICAKKLRVSLHPTAEKKMMQSHALLDQWLKKGEIIYGLNTGFGSLSDVKINASQNELLQLNLIRSHACGVGDLLTEEETRALILLRAQVLACGHSGVRPLIVKKLLELLNRNIYPYIPQKGSVGASGDLAPLAHLALVLIGEGKILNHTSFSPLKLSGREGLALINGTQLMAALSALNILKAHQLFKLFDIAAAMSLEAVQGSRMPFYADLHALRPHPGQKEVAKTIWNLTQHSKIQENHKNCDKVQDSYSFRCIPQVHGSSKDALLFAKKIIETEINSVTDNPIIFPKHKKSISGGNFHGQYLSQAMDFLSIAATTLVNISERRIEKLLDPKFSGLPACLAAQEGLESGLMLTHVTAAALASQNKVLSHPSSIESIPTSGNKEDHVSMGITAAFKAKEILKNAQEVLAIEFLAASQGIYYRRPLTTSPSLEKIHSIIRTQVPPIKKDRIFSKDIAMIKTLFPKILSAIHEN